MRRIFVLLAILFAGNVSAAPLDTVLRGGCPDITIPSGTLLAANQLTLAGAGWTASNLAASNGQSIPSPECRYNATLITETTAVVALHSFTATVTASFTAKTYTYTAYAQIGSGALGIVLQVQDSTTVSSATGYFDIGRCSVPIAAQNSGTFTNPSARVSLNNGWCKITLTYTGLVDTSSTLLFYTQTPPSSVSYAGSGVSSLVVWGVDFR